jgi:hypothetical protein
MAWSMVKLAAFWRGGKSLNVARKGATLALPASNSDPRSMSQS